MNVGHDLDAAIGKAETLGLAVPPQAPAIVGLLHPYFMRGGFHHQRREWPAALVPVALDVIDGLLCEARSRLTA